MHLVHFDIAQIQRYVFGSNKLDDHIGGSMQVQDLLDRHLEAAGAPLFGDHWSEGFDPRRPALCVIKSGGNALVLCREKHDADQLIGALSQRQLAEAPGLSLLAAQVALPPNFAVGGDESGFARARKEAERELRRQKNRQAALSFAELPPVLERCAFSDEPASRWWPPKDKQPGRWISEDLWRRRRLSQHHEGELRRRGLDLRKETALRLANDSNQLRGAEHEKSYLGFIHIDGNGLGKLLKTIERVQDLHEVSRHIAEAGLEACRAGVRFVEQHAAQLQAERRIIDGRLPLLPLLLAGDDLNFLAEGSIAIDLAAELCRAFVEHLGKDGRLRKDGRLPSACAGVALSRARAPLFHLYDLANRSCRHAKDETGRQYSALDWRFLYDEEFAVPASLRPYALDRTPNGALSFWDFRDSLLHPLLRAARDHERGPLQALAGALGSAESPERVALLFQRLAPRLGEELHDALTFPERQLGWQGLFNKERRSPLVDAVQLLDLSFLPTKKEATRG